MKRLLWLVAALCFILTPALAQENEPICSYTVAEGAQACLLQEASELDVPEGLEAMYALMRSASAASDVYLIRMPHGRALASVSCTQVDEPGDAQGLLSLWQQIAEAIGRETVYVDTSDACARVETFNGFEALCIDTSLVVGEESMLLLDARGRVFYRGNDLMEVWAVAPADPIYLFDDEAAAELKSDVSDLDGFLVSLDFSSQTDGAQTDAARTERAEGEPGADAPAASPWVSDLPSFAYADPDGYFTVELPEGCTVLNVLSTEAEVAAAREKYIAANPEGADIVFDNFYADVTDERATLILTDDMRFAAQIYCEEVPEFRGMTPRAFLASYDAVRQGLEGTFGFAKGLEGMGDIRAISGVEHAWLTYWIAAGEHDMLLEVMAAVTDEVWLREVDFYTSYTGFTLGEFEPVTDLILHTLTYLSPDGTDI